VDASTGTFLFCCRERGLEVRVNPSLGQCHGHGEVRVMVAVMVRVRVDDEGHR
jgi:hypothetical protein